MEFYYYLLIKNITELTDFFYILLLTVITLQSFTGKNTVKNDTKLTLAWDISSSEFSEKCGRLYRYYNSNSLQNIPEGRTKQDYQKAFQ
jgi:hypothetical protein